MNKGILNSLMVLLALLMIGLMVIIPGVKAGYDDEGWVGSDPIDALMQVPAATMRQFGSKGGTDKVRLCYNIAELLKVAQTQNTRIELLEKQVVELKAKANEYVPNYRKDCKNPSPCPIRHDIWVDPNEVSK